MAKMEPRVAVARGSSKGIGSAVTRQLSAYDASVVVNCSACQIIGEPGTEDPDADFIASAQNGDLQAFEELVRRHSRLIYRALVAILGDQDEAQDAMQDAFLSAFKNIAGFQGRSRFSTWLVVLAGIQRYSGYDAGSTWRAWMDLNSARSTTFALAR